MPDPMVISYRTNLPKVDLMIRGKDGTSIKLVDIQGEIEVTDGDGPQRTAFGLSGTLADGHDVGLADRMEKGEPVTFEFGGETVDNVAITLMPGWNLKSPGRRYIEARTIRIAEQVAT